MGSGLLHLLLTPKPKSEGDSHSARRLNMPCFLLFVTPLGFVGYVKKSPTRPNCPDADICLMGFSLIGEELP
jgi:hypothetical protein